MGHVRRRGEKWQARYRDPQTKRERSKSFRRKVDAEQWLAQQVADISRGTWTSPDGGLITFAEWWPTYMANTPKRASTTSRDEGAARVWLLPHLGATQLGQITPSMIRRLIKAMIDAGLAPSTVRTYYGVLQGAMTAAVEGELIGRSPCRGIKLSAERREDPRFLTLDELGRLADAIDVNYRAMVILSGVLGLRFGECAGLKVSSIDFLRRTVSITRTINEVGSEVVIGDPKTKSSRRTVSMPAEVAEELAAHLAKRAPFEPDDLVFTSPKGQPLRRKHFRSRVWLPAVAEAELEGLTFHGLRHTAVGLLIQLGTHPRVIQKRMGHSSIRTTMDVYGSILEDVDTEVVDGLSGLLAGPSESSRGQAAVNGQNNETPDPTVRPLTRGFRGGAEGSRTPGLLDATEAL